MASKSAASTVPFLRFTIEARSTPHKVQPGGAVEWDYEDYPRPIAEARYITDCFRELLKAKAASCEGVIAVKPTLKTYREERNFVLMATLVPGNNADAFGNIVNEYKKMYVECIMALLCVLTMYNEQLATTGHDVPLKLGESCKVGDSIIYCNQKDVIRVAQKLLLHDARRHYKRGELVAHLDPGTKLIIPAAPAIFPTRREGKTITLTGFFDAPCDRKRSVSLYTSPSSKRVTLKVPPELRDSVCEAHHFKAKVEATVCKTYTSLAGSDAFEEFKLLHFAPLTKSLFDTTVNFKDQDNNQTQEALNSTGLSNRNRPGDNYPLPMSGQRS